MSVLVSLLVGALVGGGDVAAGEVAREDVPPGWGERRRRDRSGERGGRKSNVWGGGRREERELVGAGILRTDCVERVGGSGIVVICCTECCTDRGYLQKHWLKQPCGAGLMP